MIKQGKFCSIEMLNGIMNTMEIDAACFSDSYLSPIFHGTWPIDKTNEIPCENSTHIINLSDSKSPGTH